MTSDSCVFQRYAFISLGANLDSSFGSPRESIEYAIKKVSALTQHPLLISTLIETNPIDCPPNSPKYVNGVVGLIPEKSEGALSLLHKLQSIENEVGRVRSGIVNEARVLDLDLILFKDERCDFNELTIPHPRAHKRKFVLEPLLELVGDRVFPRIKKPISELLKLAE